MQIKAVNRTLKQHFVSPYVGLLQRDEVYVDQDLTLGLAISCNKPCWMNENDPRLGITICGAVSTQTDAAVLSGYMEFAERFGGLFGGQRRIRWKIPCVATDLVADRLPLFQSWQYDLPNFPFKPICTKTPIRMIAARSLMTNRKVFLPLAWVRIPFKPLVAQEQLCCSTSNGLASGFSRREAMVSALFEVCERDAFMCFWFAISKTSGINLTTEALLGYEFAENLKVQRVECQFLNITHDLKVPTALCLMRFYDRTANDYFYTIGSASRSNIREACKKALYEAVGERFRQYTLFSNNTTNQTEVAEDFSHIRDFGDHPLLYRIPRFKSHLDKLWYEEKELLDPTMIAALPEDKTSALKAMLKNLAAQNYNAYVVAMDTPECLSAGIRVVKVIVPELIPVYADFNVRFLGSPRLWQKLGFSQPPAKAELLAKINPLPHPLA